MNYFHKIQLIILAAILPLTLSQCVLTNTDPGYAELESTANRNPSPTAIVGMWHRLDKRTTLKDSTMDILFRSNGEMHITGQKVILGGAGNNPLYDLHYRYAGQGVWIVSGTDMRLRISQNRLLFELPIPQYYDVVRYVLERQ